MYVSTHFYKKEKTNTVYKIERVKQFKWKSVSKAKSDLYKTYCEKKRWQEIFICNDIVQWHNFSECLFK